MGVGISVKTTSSKRRPSNVPKTLSVIPLPHCPTAPSLSNHAYICLPFLSKLRISSCSLLFQYISLKHLRDRALRRTEEMAKEMQKTSMFIERNPGDYENGDICKNLDDDGRPKRTGSYLFSSPQNAYFFAWSFFFFQDACSCFGILISSSFFLLEGTWVTASAHIITAVIGSGVLSLAWAIAQLGWVAGPAVLMAFSFITYFTSTLLADCYRAPDPVHGKRNYTYMDVVRAYLGGRKVQLCGLAQYANLVGVTVGYTITASISMVAVKRSNCFHKHGHHVKCQTSNNPFMVIFACIQIVLSQIPNFHNLSWLSILAAIMSFAYSSIGLGLSIAKVAGGEPVRTTLTGVTVGVDVSGSEKIWRTFQAIGDIAFAYAYSTVLVEIQASI
ncbi:hypothetical protein Godav_009146 [Gossypium davidsonii]|uniref:Amino acid transporter transmembrane domain-containing protein n=2 Tax=Gossypium TaxID=3633 RepID=A0A7J8SC71_GOSDV|nr:hypothetical protein [Gossypium davidsonii]MBA0659284.1 hypothetical protein [Gossypium klotzschianum]